ncbi:MAG: biopolymer transporter ExbD [Deltaproteobacteria bacterium]|nr:biopolymer transporter ExbD [Deltaproteobacteria bacterium]
MITEINVTPMVDIMLVLLIIFMVTATYLVRESLDVKLPEAASGQSKKVTLLAVTIDAKGTLALNGERVSEKQIRQFIREQKKKRGQVLEAVIAADKAVAHGKVVRIIDLVRQEGVIKFAINVLKPEDKAR